MARPIRVQTRSSWPGQMPIYSTIRMDENQHTKLSQIKEMIKRGEYHVDPRAVAEALLRRLYEDPSALDDLRGARKSSRRGQPPNPRQRRCSKPESSPEASLKITPGSPSRTRPTHATAASGVTVRRLVSIVPRELGAAQTQSS